MSIQIQIDQLAPPEELLTVLLEAEIFTVDQAIYRLQEGNEAVLSIPGMTSELLGELKRVLTEAGCEWEPVVEGDAAADDTATAEDGAHAEDNASSEVVFLVESGAIVEHSVTTTANNSAFPTPHADVENHAGEEGDAPAAAPTGDGDDAAIEHTHQRLAELERTTLQLLQARYDRLVASVDAANAEAERAYHTLISRIDKARAGRQDQIRAAQEAVDTATQ